MKKRIFLSYSTEDRAGVQAFKRHVREGGVPELAKDAEIFDPREVTPSGRRIRDFLLDSLKSSSELVVFWSSSASHSPWVAYELGAAAALDIPTIIVVPSEGAPSLPSDVSEAALIRWP